MLTYQFVNYCHKASKILEEIENSLTGLFEFSINYDTHKSKIYKTILTNSKLSTSNTPGLYITSPPENGLISEFVSLINKFRESFSLRKNYDKYIKIKTSFNEFMLKNTINHSGIDNIFNILSDIFEKYDIYLANYNNTKNAMIFSEAISDFASTFYKAKEFYIHNMELLIPDYNETVNLSDETRILEIQLLDIDLSFEDFYGNLKSINLMYEEIKLAMYNDKKVSDLKIVKIESGSLLSMVLGDKNIIESIGLFLTKTINFIFSKFTKEGKIERHGKVREQLIEDIELVERIKGLGYDITETTPIIEKATVAIVKEAHKLALSSHKIRINGTDHEFTGNGKQEYLESVKTLYLAEKNDSQSDNENQETD